MKEDIAPRSEGIPQKVLVGDKRKWGLGTTVVVDRIEQFEKGMDGGNDIVWTMKCDTQGNALGWKAFSRQEFLEFVSS